MGGAPVAADILLVEDDRQLAALLMALLTDEGYRVEVAGDGQSGLHLGLTRHYGALIIDRGLPVREGLELLRILRSNGVVTPALVLTGLGALADRVGGLDAGAEDSLVKPFEGACCVGMRPPHTRSRSRGGGWTSRAVPPSTPPANAQKCNCHNENAPC